MQQNHFKSESKIYILFLYFTLLINIKMNSYIDYFNYKFFIDFIFNFYCIRIFIQYYLFNRHFNHHGLILEVNEIDLFIL